MRHCLGLLCVLLMPAALAESLVLYTEEFFPYNYTEQQQVHGINADFVQLACKRAELDCQFQPLPWLRAYDLARHTPNGGLFSTVRTSTRELQFQWAGPLASSITYLYRMKNRPQVNPPDLEHAKSFGIAVAHGDFFEEYFLQHGFQLDQNLLRVKRKTDAVPLFLSGKIDLLIGSDQVLPGWLAPYDKGMADVEPVLNISHIGQNYLALNLQVAPEIVQRLQQAVQQLTEEGELKRLILLYHNRPMPQ